MEVSMLRIEKVGGKSVLMESEIPFFPVFKKGKVREVYDAGDFLLIVSTDRISAFDVIMQTGVPEKGIYLTKQSSFWFKFLEEEGVETHFISDDLEDIAEITGESRLLELDWLKGRVMLAKKAELLPVEAVCRFRVFGSAITALKEDSWIWDKVEIDGAVEEGALIKNGPVFTPTEKSETDDKISYAQMVSILKDESLASQVKERTIEIFKKCNDYAQKEFGFEIADGKIEWGIKDGQLILIDETFTSDSARFIPDKSKEYFRKWLKDNGLKGKSVELPEEIALNIAALYRSQCDDMKLFEN